MTTALTPEQVERILDARKAAASLATLAKDTGDDQLQDLSLDALRAVESLLVHLVALPLGGQAVEPIAAVSRPPEPSAVHGHHS